MPLILISLLSALITLADLSSAWFYAVDTQHWGIDVIRFSRDGLMAVLALWGIKSAYRTGPVFIFAALYLAWIVAYVVIGDDSVDPKLLFASASKLALPVALLAAGYGTLTKAHDLVSYALVLAAIAVASTLFGAWDIERTDFWTETVQYGHYLNGVKGIIMGFEDYYVLPFNFFGYENARRAAGLVAAPLAQGSLVAIGAVLGFAALQRNRYPLAVAVLICGILGVWQSGTRGAMLILLIALPLFLLLNSSRKTQTSNIMILLLLAVGSYGGISYVFSYSVNLEDGSTIGHVDALAHNIEDLPQVMIVGPGLGASGSLAADEGVEIAGGGEGAIFAIAYQIGVPAALIFLLFYAAILIHIFKAGRQENAAGDLHMAAFALGCGFITTFISSDHLFSLSGMGVFWIILGGVLAQWNGREKVWNDSLPDGTQ